jgi:ANTAR domain
MMETERDATTGAGALRRRSREQSRDDDPSAWPGEPGGPGGRGGVPGGGQAGPRRDARPATAMVDGRPGDQGRSGGYRGRHSQTAGTADGRRPAGGSGLPGDPAPGADGRGMGGRADDSRGMGDGAGLYRPAEPPVARRTATGWRVGDEEVSDLTSAMVLADLLAAELPAEGPPTPGGPAVSVPPGRPVDPASPDIRQLQETVAQLEHALTVRVRVEQAIGVLAERHRLRPRLAFELLRSAARARGRRVLEVAGEVVDSATNPLLRLPEELAKPPVTRRRGRIPRRPQESD